MTMSSVHAVDDALAYPSFVRDRAAAGAYAAPERLDFHRQTLPCCAVLCSPFVKMSVISSPATASRFHPEACIGIDIAFHTMLHGEQLLHDVQSDEGSRLSIFQLQWLQNPPAGVFPISQCH